MLFQAFGCAAAALALTRVSALPLALTLKLLILAVAAFSALFAGALLLQLRPLLTRANLSLLAFLFVVLVGIVPANAFGQRDQLLTLLILPYLVAAALHSVGNPISYPWRAVFALAAATGIALHPQQIAIPIAAELTVAILRRRPRLLQIALFLVAGAFYLFGSRLHLPALALFLPDAFPFAVPGAPGQAFFQLLPGMVLLALLGTLAITVYFVQRNRRRSPLTLLLLATGTAAFAASFLPGPGADPRHSPALALFVLALTFELIDLAPFLLHPAPLLASYRQTSSTTPRTRTAPPRSDAPDTQSTRNQQVS